MKGFRLDRINSEIQKIIANILNNQLRDPQITSMISVSSVETTPDLGNSYIYISCYGEDKPEEVLARIKGAAGFIRGELSKKINLRITPRLEFRLDTSAEYGAKINQILETISYTTNPDDKFSGDE